MEIKRQNNIINIVSENEIINIINCKFDDSDIYSILLEKDGLIIYTDGFVSRIKCNPINKKMDEILPKDEYEIFRKLMLHVIFTTNRIVSEIVINNRIHNIILSPILDGQLNVKYLLLNGCDETINKKIENEISEMKQKLEESNSIKSIFLSNISHELRTPMNAIIGFSELLISDNNNIIQSEKFLKTINSNAIHLDELLNNILDYSRIESNDFDLLYENFSINDLFNELYSVFSDLNYKKNLDFVKINFIINEDKKIISDYLRLKQVLFNIISNSIKFTENGYINISYTTDEKFITFKIEDTGVGIPKDKIQFVFDRFWQFDSSSRKKYKGTGLGLSISKSITEMLGGKIKVESEVNKGTTFYVKIKLEEIKHDVLIENKNKINFSGKTLLIIDELPINYSLLGIYLKSLNFNIEYAYSGKVAIEIYKKQKQKIELIILDINLPDMEAINLIKKIQHIQHCTIITISSQILVGANYHINKPINKEKLLSILNKIWKK